VGASPFDLPIRSAQVAMADESTRASNGRGHRGKVTAAIGVGLLALGIFLAQGSFFHGHSAACSGNACATLGSALSRIPLPQQACVLLSNAAVANTFGAAVDYRTKTRHHECAWFGAPFPNQFGRQSVTMSVARATREAFVKGASHWIGPGSGGATAQRSVRVPLAGAIAFAQINGTELQVWYRGIVIDISSTLVPSPLESEKRLATAAIASLKRASAALAET
jgi:hypothetical protein